MANKLITIARYSYSAEAQLAKGRLEAEGIFAFVADEQTVTLNYSSQAVGGIKLMINESDAEIASQLLGLPSKGSPAPVETFFVPPHRSPLSLYIWGLVGVIVVIVLITKLLR